MSLRPPTPALLIVPVFSRHASLLGWTRQRLESLYGPVTLASPVYAFTQTAYYERTMGAGLHKQLLAFQDLIDPGTLATIKRRTIDLEEEAARTGEYPEVRPVNIDPGYLVLGKFLLATTKDQAHRIYLGEGIYAEVTLQYREGTFQPWPWTYADYRLAEVIDFLNLVREQYHDRLRRL